MAGGRSGSLPGEKGTSLRATPSTVGTQMKQLLTACCFVALALPLFSAPAEGMERKCSVTPGGRAVVAGAPPLYVIDGIISEYSEVFESLGPEQIERITISCVDVKEGEHMVGRTSINVVTKGGVVPALRSHLQRLVERQEEHRTRTSAYATDLAALGFYTGQQPAPIELTVTDAGWSAIARIQQSPAVCRVAVAIEAGSRNDVQQGIVACAESGP